MIVEKSHEVAGNCMIDFLAEINAGVVKPPKSREDQTGIA